MYEDEYRFWNYIYIEVKVVFIFGKDCASDESGWFRMCFVVVFEYILC